MVGDARLHAFWCPQFQAHEQRTPKMKPASRSRKLLAMLPLLVLLVFLVGATLAAKGPRPMQFKLADGRIVELLTVTTGKVHNLPASSVRDLAHRYAPRRFQRVLGPNFKSSLTFPSDGLALWLMCYDPALKRYVSGNWVDRLVVLDEHGCEMTPSGSGEVGDGNFMATVFHLSAFPRRQKHFTCRLFDTRNGKTNVLGEITIQNPLPVSTVQLSPEALPITRTNVPLVVRLNSIAKKGYGYTIIGDDKVQGLWPIRYHHFEDATGNQGDFLCRKETWKWVATFFRNEHAPFEPNETWTFENFTPPKPGEIQSIGSTKVLADYPLKILYMGGPGTYTFSNSVCISASASVSSHLSWNESARKGRTNFITTTIGSRTPFAIIEHDRLAPESEVMMRLRDGDKIVALVQDAQESNPYWPHNWWHYSLVQHRPDSIWPTNKPLTLDVIVQRGRKLEFPIPPLSDQSKN